MEFTNIIVWLDNNDSWNRVYRGENGKLYIEKQVATVKGMKNQFVLLNDCFVRKIGIDFEQW